MKILILGSNSYFARNFTYYLKTINNNFWIIGIDKLINQNINIDEFYQIDLAKPFDINKFSGYLTINFASLSHVDVSFKQPKMVYENNVMLAINIAKLSSKNRLIHISTDEVDDVSNPYSISKFIQELILKDWNIIRFNNLYSNFDTFGTFPTQPTIWNVLRQAKKEIEINHNKVVNVVKDYDKITRNFLPIQIACTKLWEFILSNKKIETVYNGFEISIKDFIKEYENKYQIYFNLNIVPNRKNTDYRYAINNPINYNDFIKYL